MQLIIQDMYLQWDWSCSYKKDIFLSFVLFNCSYLVEHSKVILRHNYSRGQNHGGAYFTEVYILVKLVLFHDTSFTPDHQLLILLEFGEQYV
jgi:hypothetical protein